MKILNALILTIALGMGTALAGGVQVGDKAPAFQLKNVDGKMISPESYPNAKGFIIVFTCNECPYAKAYEDRIIALDKKFAAKGYPVIAINPNDAERSPSDSYANMQERAKEKAFPFPYLQDKDQSITSAYGAARTPTIFVLKKENKDLVVKYLGAIDNNTRSAEDADKKYVESAVQSLIDGKEIAEKETKAIGCGIKWASTN